MSRKTAASNFLPNCVPICDLIFPAAEMSLEKQHQAPGFHRSNSSLGCTFWLHQNILLIFNLGICRVDGLWGRGMTSHSIYLGLLKLCDCEVNWGSEPIYLRAACLNLQNSWQPAILTYSHFPSSLKNRPCQLQQTAFKNILLDYIALPSKFLTMPVSVPHSIKKGVADLISFFELLPCYKYPSLGRRAQTPVVWSHLRANLAAVQGCQGLDTAVEYWSVRSAKSRQNSSFWGKGGGGEKL